MEVDHSTNTDRLEYLYLNLVGQLVQITTVDGAVSEGVFVSRTDPETPEDEAGVIVSCSRFLRSQVHKPLDAAEFTEERRLYAYKDIVMMEAAHLKIRTETPGAGNVFSYRGEHDLKALDWAEDGNEELLEGDRTAAGWDQFEANKRFGVRSTYDEGIYTTKLDKSKMTKEQLEYAERVAREIERSAVRGVQHAAEREDVAPVDVDEGALYSDVARKPKTAAQPPAAAPGRKAPEVSNAKAVAGKRGGAEEPAAPAAAPPPLEGPHSRDFNPNPAAAPFVPSRPIINDYLKSLADAISSNPACYQSDPDWPGEEDHYDKDDSSYTQMQQQQQQQPMMQPNQFHGGNVQPVPQQAQPLQGFPPVGHGAPPPANFGRPGQGHHVMHGQNAPMGFNGNNNMGGHFNPNMHHHMSAPPPPQQQQQYMDPNQSTGPSPGQQQPRMGGGAPMPQPQTQPRPSGKSSQPQQPVSTPLPMHQQQQQPPPQPTAVAPVDSSAGAEKQAAPKKLTRGVKAAQPRVDAAGSGDGASAGGKRGGK